MGRHRREARSDRCRACGASGRIGRRLQIVEEGEARELRCIDTLRCSLRRPAPATAEPMGVTLAARLAGEIP
jgi:hypothetical protein